MIDLNAVKKLLNTTQKSNVLVLSVNSLENDSYKNYKVEIDKFIKKDQDYVVIVVKK